jgi:hypothetical protein
MVEPLFLIPLKEKTWKYRLSKELSSTLSTVLSF